MPEPVDHLSLLDRFRARSVKRAIPLQASIELTYRCNERCTHCYIEDFKDNPKKTLSKEQWFKVLSELRDAGTLYLILMGGEAMLNPHFWDVAQKASEMSFHVSMISNGIKIKDLQVAQRLAQVGVSVVTFSVYSLDEAVHDKMTSVRGSLQKTLRAVELCEEAGVVPSINSLLTEANAPGIFDLYEWCEKKGYDFKVDPTVTPKLNGDLGPTQYRATKETLLWFYRERARRWERSRPAASGESKENFVCNAAKGKCAVNPYGELLPCIEIREPMGSLVTSPFSEVWRNPIVDKWRNMKIGQLENLGDLQTYNFCDNCPGMNQHENGNAKKINSYSKMVAQVKRQVAEEKPLS